MEKIDDTMRGLRNQTCNLVYGLHTEFAKRITKEPAQPDNTFLNGWNAALEYARQIHANLVREIDGQGPIFAPTKFDY